MALWSLALAKNQVQDIAPLAKLTKVSTLDLRDNKVANLGPLAAFTELRYLMLDKNQVKDLSPLVKSAEADAKGAKRFAPYLNLFLTGSPVDEAQVEALKSIGVRVTR